MYLLPGLKVQNVFCAFQIWGTMTLKTMVTMVNVPYKINRKKKGGGGEWEGVGVVTAW